MDNSADRAVQVVNHGAASPFVLVCDHASNRIPSAYGDLGLPPSELVRHIAWDPGALAVSLRLTELLDAALVHSTVSRLIIDCNRDLDAPDLVAPISELTEIPGNAGLSGEEIARRIALVHAPFHAAIDQLLEARAAAGTETILVCMHSFTPVFKGNHRPWHIGLIHGRDQGYTIALRDALAAAAPELNIGWNEPYSALSGVTYTLEHHGDGRGLQSTMIEIRNDEILEPAGVELWAQRLRHTLVAAAEARHAAAPERPSPRSQPYA